MKIEQLIKSLTELEKLKTVERGLNVGNRKESSAEHSWSCLLIADVVLDFVNEPLDKLKVFEYLLYHDVVEVYAGDAKFNNPEEMKLKQEKEEKALEKISSFLPNSNRFQKIMAEYEHRKTRESEFAKAIDCIDSCVRNLNDEKASNKDGFTESLIRRKYEPHVSKFPITEELFETLMKRLVELEKV
ncbi:HD domain-containing protein [Flagellimonas meridianipacifica]|uniref:Putative hydrolase of HD superfamily n=1 Tax=Flagellimonas meridianipacifica TaxID=1080225 RepID=A0A2T0MGF1_9FLAO|nr:HD domain-containing protein [Allomuricauda pacifica]PRX56653.1 putative hydrolase of HD superfamily [Allomuricauda pacifica]